jgi:cytoskeleton protein RodZ
MFAIGDSLREARTRRGLSSADVQKGIRIRERYLTALEEERWELLPGEAYTKGFLRTYAEFLGLDGGLYIDEYNARIAVHDEEPLVPQSLAPSHRTRRGVMRTLMGIIVLSAVIAGFAAWGMGGGQRTASQGAAAGLRIADANAAPQPVALRAIPHAKPLPVAAALPAPRTVAAAKTVITASRGRSWLSVRTGGPNGQVLFQGVLELGRTLHYTVGRQQLWVRMGRPRNVDITLGAHRVNGLPPQPANVLLTRSGPQAA